MAVDGKPITNLFERIPSDLPDELIETLFDAKELRVERIVSQGHASPAGCWYDQEQHEWVVLLTGSATVRFAEQDRISSPELAQFQFPARRWPQCRRRFR